MTSQRDQIELEYERAIAMASDTDEAYELSIGLSQYRELYKIPPERRVCDVPTEAK